MTLWIARSGEMRPLTTLVKTSTAFALAAAVMVAATYSLAYLLRFSAYRFTVAGGVS